MTTPIETRGTVTFRTGGGAGFLRAICIGCDNSPNGRKTIRLELERETIPNLCHVWISTLLMMAHHNGKKNVVRWSFYPVL